MTDASVTYQKEGHVGYITLNRPQTGNILDLQTAREMAGICGEIKGDDEVYVVVLAASGAVFSKGSEQEQAGKTGTAEGNEGFCTAPEAIGSIEQPVIAVLTGDALGQGLELALACDIRFASQSAKFGMPQVMNGLMPTGGGTQRLPRIVGKGKALELMLTGDTVDAAEALEIGLVHKVVSETEVLAEASAVAEKMAKGAPISLRMVKEAVNKGLDLTLEQGMHLEADLYFLMHTTTDRREGITAFVEKRTPEFRGE